MRDSPPLPVAATSYGLLLINVEASLDQSSALVSETKAGSVTVTFFSEYWSAVP